MCFHGALCSNPFNFVLNICYHVAAFRDSLKFDMHHDDVLKMWNFDLLTPTPGSGGGCRWGSAGRYLLPCYWIHDSL